MSDVLQEMVAHYEITKVLTQYCQGCDRADHILMQDVYAPDAWDDHGNNKGPAADFVKITLRNVIHTEMCSHILGQSAIRLDGDEAAAETYFLATVRTRTGDGAEVVNQLGGRYVDELTRSDGRWKITTRVCVRDWSISHPLNQDWLAEHAFVQGQRSGDDPAFAALRMKHSGLAAS